MSFEDWQKDNQTDFGKWQQENATATIPTPDNELVVAEDVLKKATDLELSIDDVQNNYPAFVAAPEEGKISQLFQKYIKDPLSEHLGLFEPDIGFRQQGVPEGLRWDRVSELKTELPAAALHIASERISGLGLSAPDILAQEFDRYILDSEKPVATLSELVEKITKLKATGKTRQAAEMTGQLFKFMGGLKTARKILGPLINRLPVRQSLSYMFGAGIELGTVSLTEEISQKITSNEDLDWERIHKAAGWGVVFGGAQSIVGKIMQFKDVKEAVKFEPRLAKIPSKLLRRVVEAGQAKTNGMTRGAWMKVYGEDMQQFTRELQKIAETPLLAAEPVVKPSAEPAQPAPVAKPPAEAKIVPLKPTEASKPAPVITTKEIEGPQPTVSQRNAGFVKLPPVSVVNEIGAEHPNIDVPLSKRDIGVFQNTILTPVNQARNTKNQDIIEAAETMALTGMEMNNDIRVNLQTDTQAFKTLPKEFKADKGAKFFELMDKHFSPEEIDAATDVPEEVKPVLKHFKLQDETMRQEVISQKRELNAKFNEKKSLKELQVMAKAQDIPIRKEGKPKKAGKKTVTQQVNRTKAELSKDLAKTQIPDDWGKQWSHIQHIFFGQYTMFFETPGEKGPVRHFIGKAETRAEAYQKLLDWKLARKEAGHTDYNTIKLTATPELNIPLDVLRLTKAQFGVLKQQLQRGAEINEQEISDALKGVIGLKSTKQKWWGSLLERKGKAGFSTDFQKVWEAQTTQFQRWKHITKMNKEVQPLIEKVKAQGLPGWANFLEETKDFVSGQKRAVSSKALDQFLERVPVLSDYIKPFALERWSANVKGFQYWTKLQTGRFYVLNSLQPIQTLWPVVGTKRLASGVKLFYSKEGQDLLRKHKVSGTAGKLHETIAVRGRRFERFLPAGASEIRNQGIAFLTLFDYAQKELGFSEEAAAHYGRLRGQLFTQFAYTAGDVPRAMRGPIGGTILQFKRFQIKNLELFSRLLREGRIGGAARWVTAIAMLGGLKGLTSGLALFGAGAYVSKKIYDKIKEEAGEEAANVVAFGLPALLGVDMSGSVTPLDVPFGRTTAERIGNTILGPTGQQIVRLVSDIADPEVAKEVGAAQRALDSLAKTSPTIKQFQFLIKALERDTSTFDSKQRKQFELEVEDLWQKAFGFRPIDESQQRLFIEAFHAVKNEYDDVADKIALDLIELNEISQDGLPKDFDKWPDNAQKTMNRLQKNLKNWSATYPEFPITSESVLNRVKNKVEARQYTQLQREWLQLSKNLKGAFVQDVLE